MVTAESPGGFSTNICDSASSDSMPKSEPETKRAPGAPTAPVCSAAEGLRHRASAPGDGDAMAVAGVVESSLSVHLDHRVVVSGTECMDAVNDNAPQRGAKLVNRDDWLIMPGESVGSYVKRLFTEGHTVPDAFMTCACAQVGQIMLNSPNALYKMGIVAGGISMCIFLICGYWTIYEFMCIYLEYKRCKMRDGTWWETDGKHIRVVQMFEVYGHFLGMWAKVSSLLVMVVILIGLLMTQINACAVNMYWVDKSRTKQEWALIYGGTMAFTMIAFPKFTHFRLANIFGLVTVLCMSVYMVIVATTRGFQPAIIKFWPTTSQDYFTGAAVWLTILGTHAVTFETLEGMEQPKHFKTSFSMAWAWTILVTVPSSFLCNFAYPDFFMFLEQQKVLAYADNIFSLLESTSKGVPGTGQTLVPPRFGVVWNLTRCTPTVSQAKYAMAILMNIHQFVAFALFGTSLAFVWEKLLGIHTRPWYIRVPARIPLSGLIWFLAILCPFYGAINALLASLAVPYLGFVLPSLCLLTFFKSRAQLKESCLQCYGWVTWTPEWLATRLEAINPRLGLVFTVWWFCNAFMIVVFSGFGGAAIYYSCKLVSENFHTFGVFAKCYACTKAVPCPKTGIAG